MSGVMETVRRNMDAFDAGHGEGAARIDGICTLAALIVVAVELAVFAIMFGGQS